MQEKGRMAVQTADLKTMPRSSLHIQITAHDRPGILAEILGFIVDVGWNVVDIKQFVFNRMLNLSILLDGEDSLISPLKTVLTKYAGQRNFKVAIYPLKEEIQAEVPYSHRSVVTLLCATFPSTAFLEITKTFADLDINIIRIEQLDSGDIQVLEFVIGKLNY